MRIACLHRLVAPAALALTLAGAGAAAQQTPIPSSEELTARIEALQADTSEPGKAAIEDYRQALAALTRAAQARARADEFALDASQAPGLLASLQAELAEWEAGEDPQLDRAVTLSEIESRFMSAQADLSASRTKVQELEALDGQRDARRAALPNELVSTNQALAKLRETLDVTPLDADSEPRRTLLLAQFDEYEATLAAGEAERAALEAQREVLPLRRERAQRRLASAERTATFWKQQVDTRRASEGEAAAVDAHEQLEEIAMRYPALRDMASRYRQLTGLRSGENGLPRRIARARAEMDSARALLGETNHRFRTARRRVAAGGLTEGMGLILRRDHEWLLTESALARATEAVSHKLSDAQLELINVEEERPPATGSGLKSAALLAELGLSEASDELVETARGIREKQREAWNAAVDDLEALTSIYYEGQSLARELLASGRAYRTYIEKRILWVRSSPRNPLESVLQLPVHAREIASAIARPEFLGNVGDALLQRPILELVTVAALLLLTLARRRFKRKRNELGNLVRSYRTDTYVHTLSALLLTVLLALPGPWLLWALGQLFVTSPDELLRAVGAGLRDAALVWVGLALLRGLLADKGVGQAHFRWPAASLKAVRRELGWFLPLSVCLGFAVVTLDRRGHAAWSGSVGRLCFVAGMLALSVLLHRLLRRDSDLWADRSQGERGLLGKTHGLWHAMATGLPLALTLAACLGYYYTALQLELRLRYTLRFAVVLVLVNALLLRWLFITRRRLAVRQALDARARREEEGKEGASETSSTPIDADAIDIPAVDAQTRKLFRSSITLAALVGAYLIWASVLPALQGLDRIQLLPRVAIVSGEEAQEPDAGAPEAPAATAPGPGSVLPGTPAASGTSAPEAQESSSGLPATLTLADLLLALLFLVLTSIAAKNLPALLELSLLQRMPLDGGARYAISSIVRYMIVIVGLSVVSGAVGVGWRQVQWLAAALTFGLAFGLQEIFANFVSGLIILIERPVRVGDIVTVGTVEGRVTQLRMRSTIVQDWDRRELIIPNKEFITGSVINWTLSDPITRIVLPVGIAYGSDTVLARRLLLETARKNPLIMNDPGARVIFRSFGESSLDFELRVYIDNRDLWPEVVDGLHTAIDDTFREARIEIAFPQRDVHMRSQDPPAPTAPDPA